MNTASTGTELDLSVIVPVRNAERLIAQCLTSILKSNPREIIVVDGMSTDRTIDIAQSFPVRILSDEGQGVAAARSIGVQEASSHWVALVDVDIVFSENALADLLDEFRDGKYTALQAGLQSVSNNGYWGRALVEHHRAGRSRNWPGVMATIFERETLLKYKFDHAFLSGEDIELRWRLQRDGARLGCSRRTIVDHWFDDTFDFARGQWLADGGGLARMVNKYGVSAAFLLGLPVMTTAWGMTMSIISLKPHWVPYYLCYFIFNYVGMLNTVRDLHKNTPWIRTGEAQQGSLYGD